MNLTPKESKNIRDLLDNDSTIIFRSHFSQCDEFICLKISLEKIQAYLFASLKKQALIFVLLHYKLSKLSGDYGVVNSATADLMIRTLHQKYFHTDSFTSAEAFADSKLTELDVIGIEFNSIKHRLSNYTFTLFNKVFELKDIQKINQLLTFFESKLMIYYEFSSSMAMLVFGKGKRRLIKKKYSLLQFQEEFISTFNVVPALAASTNDRISMVRNVAMELIYEQKWVSYYNYSSTYDYNDFYSISSGIKQKVINLYGQLGSFTSDEIKNQFVKDMQENVLNHEIGHLVVQADIFSVEDVGLGVCTQLIKETIFLALWEIFADFAPKTSFGHGCIFNMCKVAETDYDRALRLFYMYLSDVWFYDTADEYMFLYSDLMLLVLLRYIDNKQGVDFAALKSDLSFTKKRVDKERLTLSERLFELFSWSIQEIKVIVETAKYTLVADEEKDFSFLLKTVKSVFPEYRSTEFKDSLVYQKTFWMNVVGYLRAFSVDGYKELNDYIDTQEKKILKKMMILSCGKKKAESYGYDHRKYIVDRMKALGFDGQ